MSDVLDLTRRLVSIPSHEDERAAGEAVATWLREETDATVRHDDAGVIARRSEGSESLALVGHHDVVAPADEQREGPRPSESRPEADDDDDGYVVTEREGRLHGRGTADMKGSLAAAMVAPLPYPKLRAGDAMVLGLVQVAAVAVPTAFSALFPRIILVAATAYAIGAPWFYWGKNGGTTVSRVD